jgi:hypothetical protein
MQLLSDVEIGGDLHDTTAGRDEVEDPAPAGGYRLGISGCPPDYWGSLIIQ